MVFVVVGVIAGPLVLGDIDPSTSGSAVRSLAEATLALVLFSDAARIDLRKLRQERVLPMRLLGIGLPLTILAGALVAVAIFPALTVMEALALAIILAPTYAALGQAVVTNPLASIVFAVKWRPLGLRRIVTGGLHNSRRQTHYEGAADGVPTGVERLSISPGMVRARSAR